MATETKKRAMVEISEEARDALKTVAAIRKVTMRDLVEQAAREMAKAENVRYGDEKSSVPSS